MDVAGKPLSSSSGNMSVSGHSSHCDSTGGIFGSLKAGVSTPLSSLIPPPSTKNTPEPPEPVTGIMKRKTTRTPEPADRSVTLSAPIRSPEDLFCELGIQAGDAPTDVIQQISEQCLQLTQAKSHFSRYVQAACRTPDVCQKASVGLHELFNMCLLNYVRTATEAYQQLAESSNPSACNVLYAHLETFEHNLSLVDERAVASFGGLQKLVALCREKRQLLENLSNNYHCFRPAESIESLYSEKLNELSTMIDKRLSRLLQAAERCLFLPYVVNAPVVLMFREADRITVFNLVPDKASDHDILVIPLGSPLTKQAKWMLTHWLRLADFRFYGESGQIAGIADNSRIFSLRPEEGGWSEWESSVASTVEKPVIKTRIPSTASSSSSDEEPLEPEFSVPMEPAGHPSHESTEPPLLTSVTVEPLASEPLDDAIINSLIFSHGQVEPILGRLIDLKGNIDHQIALLELCSLFDESGSRPIREALQQKIQSSGQTSRLQETETLLRHWLSSSQKSPEGSPVTFRELFRMLLEVSEALTDEQKETMRLALNNAVCALIDEPQSTEEPEGSGAGIQGVPSSVQLPLSSSEPMEATASKPCLPVPSTTASSISGDDRAANEDYRQLISKPQRIPDTTQARLRHLGLQVEPVEYKTTQGALLAILYPHVKGKALPEASTMRVRSLKRFSQTMKEWLSEDMVDLLKDKYQYRYTLKQSLEICSVLGGHTDGHDCLVNACASEDLIQHYKPVSSISSAIERARERARTVAGDHGDAAVDTLLEQVCPLKDPLLLQTLSSGLMDKNVVLLFEDPEGNLYIFNSDKSEFPEFKNKYRVKESQISPSDSTVWIKPDTPVTEQNKKLVVWLKDADLCLYNQFRVVGGKVQLTLTQELKPMQKPAPPSPPRQLGGLEYV